MRIRDAIKLKTGDKIRCGPNDCGCDGRVYTVLRIESMRTPLADGSCPLATLYYHSDNLHPFIMHRHDHMPAWNPDDEIYRAFARTIRKAE